MSIQPGDKIPTATVFEMGPDGPGPLSTDDLFGGKTVVVFGLPGAFTPTCSAQHLPGYIQLSDQLKAKGVDDIVCLSVNDAFVMAAWGQDQNVNGKVRMIADGAAELTKKLGLELDLTGGGMGVRSDRYAMIVKDGVVESLDREEPRQFEVSSAAAQLSKL